MKNNHHFRPIKGTKFSTDTGQFLSLGITSFEILEMANVVTGKHHQRTIKQYEDAIDEGKIFDIEL